MTRKVARKTTHKTGATSAARSLTTNSTTEVRRAHWSLRLFAYAVAASLCYILVFFVASSIVPMSVATVGAMCGVTAQSAPVDLVGRWIIPSIFLTIVIAWITGVWVFKIWRAAPRVANALSARTRRFMDRRAERKTTRPTA